MGGVTAAVLSGGKEGHREARTPGGVADALLGGADMSDCTPRRHPIPKRLRWQVLERDNHTCQYCGATPADGALHLDHIIPVADGGKTEADNLITSCEPCNTGKGTGVPVAPPLPNMAEAADELKRKIEAIHRWRNTKAQYENEVLAAANALHGQYGLSIPHNIVAAAIREYGIDEAVYAGQVVCGKIHYTDPQGQSAYFYGVLRNRATGESKRPRTRCLFDFTPTCHNESCEGCSDLTDLYDDDPALLAAFTVIGTAWRGDDFLGELGEEIGDVYGQGYKDARSLYRDAS